MKPIPSLSIGGLILCLFVPLLNLHMVFRDSSATPDFRWLAAITVLPVVIMLAIFWAVYRKRWNWQSVSEYERNTFLKREQMSKLKLWATMLAYMLVVTTLDMLFVYGLDWPRNNPHLSMLTILYANWEIYLLTSIVAMLWLAVCDRKLRLSRSTAS